MTWRHYFWTIFALNSFPCPPAAHEIFLNRMQDFEGTVSRNAAEVFLCQYSLVLNNWFSDIIACTVVACIQWRQRTNMTAPGCTRRISVIRNGTQVLSSNFSRTYRQGAMFCFCGPHQYSADTGADIILWGKASLIPHAHPWTFKFLANEHRSSSSCLCCQVLWFSFWVSRDDVSFLLCLLTQNVRHRHSTAWLWPVSSRQRHDEERSSKK